MTLLAWLFGLIVAIVAIAIAVAFLNRFYRKTSRDVAIIRTGFGGQRIVLSGGCLALPFLHKVDEVNMRTLRIEVARAGPKSLITEDRMRVDVELEFYLRVQPTVDGVATAAQAIGSKSLSPDGVRNLLEGRFIDAIQATAAGLTMDSLHDRRGEFVRSIHDSVRENLASSGLQLESVSLTRMDQAAFAALDDNNAFNAVGLKKLAEIIANSKKKRAEIEADADVSVRQTQLEAIKQRLQLMRQEEEAQIASDADTARAREQATVAAETARIEREQSTRLAEIQKARELRRIEIEAQLASEVRKVDSSITLAHKHAEEAKAQATAEKARTEIVLAQEQLQTERERAVAERSHEMALKREEERGAVETSKAQSDTEVLLMQARADATATTTKAEAQRIRLMAESEGTRALIAAENSRSGELMRMQLEQYRLDRMPEILGQLVKPAEKIDSIRIHQVTGFGASSTPGGAGASLGGDGANGRPPVAQVMDSILGMALQLPALKSIGESIGVDLSTAVGAPHGDAAHAAASTGTKPLPKS
jgi:flotillin